MTGCGGYILSILSRLHVYQLFTPENILNYLILVDFKIFEDYGVLLLTIRKMLVMKSKVIVRPLGFESSLSVIS